MTIQEQIAFVEKESRVVYRDTGVMQASFKAVLATLRRVQKLEAVAEAAWEVVDSVPATYDESCPTVRRHAAAMNALAALKAAKETP